MNTIDFDKNCYFCEFSNKLLAQSGFDSGGYL